MTSKAFKNVSKLNDWVNVSDYGAIGNGIADDSAAINAALVAAAVNGQGVVVTDPNRNYKVHSSITVPTGVSLQMADGAALIYYGSAIAVRVEPDAPDNSAETYSEAQFQRHNIIRVIKQTIEWQNSAGNLDTTSTGIQVVNARYSSHELHAVGFFVGVELLGVDEGYAAGGTHVGNTYTIYARNNKTHVLETRQGTTGYVNLNTWVGGLMRNDGGYVSTGTRGFDGSAGANNWIFIGVNTEGANISQIYRFGGPFNAIYNGRFENATDGMIKILSGGHVDLFGCYLGALGEKLFSVDTGGSWNLLWRYGSWQQNGLASNASYTAKLTGTSGYFRRDVTAAGLTLAEVEGGVSLHREGWYTIAGKYDASTNPSGLTNPTVSFDYNARAFRFRTVGDDAENDATAMAVRWGTDSHYLTWFNGGIKIDNAAWDGYPLRLGNYFLWVDATGDLRIKNGAPSSDTDGTVVGTQS